LSPEVIHELINPYLKWDSCNHCLCDHFSLCK